MAVLNPRDRRGGSGLLIGLAAKKQHGKDTVADWLVAKHGFERESFASPMKRSAAAALGTSVRQLEELKENPRAKVQLVIEGEFDENDLEIVADITVREYLQRVGTEAHRKIPEFGEDVWVDMMGPKLKPEKNYVVTDARFRNEQEQIKALGGYVIQIDRPGMPEGDGHDSEQIDHGLADYIIDNDSTIPELGKRVDLVVMIIREEHANPFPNYQGLWRH